ncbi:hypothetical protein EMN47_07155 [Prolixibacteraceae bacterium JC049]|nr:hypothetical protein [Prolixibacteraceae bacterium JC049]
MRFHFLVAMLLLASVITKAQQKEILKPVPFNEVKLEDQFWLPRLKTQAETLVPFALDKTNPAVENLRKAGQILAGNNSEKPFPHRFVSSDLYKVMEGAAYLLKIKRDPKLEKQLDDIINIIGKAQQKDGYLYVAHIADVAKKYRAFWGPSGMGDKPYSWVVHSHELYNMGHMYEGAIAYFQATGKRKWLDIAEKNAQHINKVFFVGDKNYNNGKPINQAPGHQELELALVKMARVTNNSLYLDMAKKFLAIRGITYVPEGKGCMHPEYAQQHKPLTEQSRAVGHSVRAAYLYSAMADVNSLTDEEPYKAALDRIWHNIVDTKMHITGGLGAVHGTEGFGPEYVLPNKSAYDETCAAVGNVFFNFRMFLAEKDGRFLDVAEVALYNNALAGVNIDGNKFFYTNPLEVDGQTPFNHGRKGRSPWFGTACCPSNIARLIPQVSGMMYAIEDNSIYCAFYGSNSTQIQLESGKVAVSQQTNYPFSGKVDISLSPEKAGQQFTVKLRVPTWATKQFVPGKLYSYTDKNLPEFKLFVNGKKAKATLDKGFVSINRKWNKNDKVTIDIPMPAHFNKAIEEVKDDKNRIALTRGPLVYCAEEVDNNGIVQRFMFDNEKMGKFAVSTIEEGKLKGIDQVTVKGLELKKGKLKKANIVFTPYYAWNNRGDASMIIWTPTDKSMVSENTGTVTGGKFAKVKASHTFHNDHLSVISANNDPKNSFDNSMKRWTSYPEKGKKQWVDITLKKRTNLQSISIYWYDDKGGVQVPKNWNLQYWHKDHWHDFPLYVTDSYSVFINQYNMVHPAGELKTDRIRINMTAKEKAAVGILDVRVEAVN